MGLLKGFCLVLGSIRDSYFGVYRSDNRDVGEFRDEMHDIDIPGYKDYRRRLRGYRDSGGKNLSKVLGKRLING